MRALLKIFIFVFALMLFFVSCKNETKTNTSGIAGYVSETPVPVTEIDKIAQQELYDELYRIFLIRKTAFREYVKQHMLDEEAMKNGMKKDEYLEKYFRNRLHEDSIKKYISEHNITTFPELKRSLKYYDVNSSEGKKMAGESYKIYLEKKLIDSLYIVYKPKMTIEAPVPPRIELNNIYTHYRGNHDAKVTVLEVSDMECSKCREYHPVYAKLYNKYKDKVKFGYIHFASYLTLSAIATEAASNQGKFWEMKEAIYKMETLPDTNQLLNIARQYKLDINAFLYDLNNPEIEEKLNYSFKLIKYYGIYATPTILVNGKPVFDSSSETEIEKAINEVL